MPDEFEDQPKKSINWHDYMALVRRRSWYFLIPFFLGWLVIWSVSWVLPATYRSGTLIIVEQPTVPQDLVKTNIAGSIQDRLQSITQQILSRTRLLHVIEAVGLYPEYRNRLTADDLVEKMRKDIEIELVKAQGEQLSAFNVYYSASSPIVAQLVTSKLTSLFISQNVEVRQQQSQDTTTFLGTQLEEARKTLSEQEERVRRFKERHLGELPGQTQSNLQILSGLQAQLQSAEDNLSSAKQQNTYLESLLSQYHTSQRSTGTEGTNSQVGLPAIDQQLDKLRSQLADLSSHYTDRHPDVRKLKEEIAKTERMKRQLTGELNRRSQQPSTDNPISTADYSDASTPAIMQVQSQLKANRIEIASRERAIDGIEKEIRDYQGRLNQAPVREQEFIDVTRGYEQSKANYDNLLKKEKDSELATNLELSQQGEHFQILDPPSLPQKPYFPNRLKMCGIGLAIGMILGVAFAVGSEFVDDRLYSDEELKKLIPVDVISEIPVISTVEEDRRSRLQVRILWATTALIFTLMAIGSALSFFRG
jgi:polysaccharide biosynthesis transport protein